MLGTGFKLFSHWPPEEIDLRHRLTISGGKGGISIITLPTRLMDGFQTQESGVSGLPVPD